MDQIGAIVYEFIRSIPFGVVLIANIPISIGVGFFAGYLGSSDYRKFLRKEGQYADE